MSIIGEGIVLILWLLILSRAERILAAQVGIFTVVLGLIIATGIVIVQMLLRKV